MDHEDRFQQLVTQSLNTLKNLLKQMDVPTSIADDAMFTLEVAFDDIYCTLTPFFNASSYQKSKETAEPKAKAKESSELKRIGEAPSLRRILDEDHSGYIQSFPY